MKTNPIKHAIAAALLFATLGLSLSAQERRARSVREVRESTIAKAEAGDVAAQYELGSFYDAGRKGLKRDYNEARRWYELAAQGGHAEAMCALGVLYDNGLGVAQDYAKANEWYRKSAERGDERAMRKLGEAYLYGYGVTVDKTKALEWLIESVKLGDVRANRHLIEHFGLDWLRQERTAKAEAGDADEQFALGQDFFKDKNFSEARKWLQMAANQGHPKAPGALEAVEFNMGLSLMAEAYENEEQRRKELVAKAEAGDADAQLELGEELVAEGERIEGKKWLERAANQGHPEAPEKLMLLEILMSLYKER